MCIHIKLYQGHFSLRQDEVFDHSQDYIRFKCEIIKNIAEIIYKASFVFTKNPSNAIYNKFKTRKLAQQKINKENNFK